MLLQCEMELGGADPALTWLRGEILESLHELNAEGLALCAAQAGASPESALLGTIARGWSALDGPGRRRATGCLYLFLDAGFASPERWQLCGAREVGDAGEGDYAPFFTAAGATELAQAVFTFAWHLARCQGAAACLLLGMPASCVSLLAQRTLGQVRALALAHPHWLRLRWAAQVDAWRGLLDAAASGDRAALERARLRGQALLAAEARGAVSPGRSRLPPLKAPAARYAAAGLGVTPGLRLAR